jgi:NAD(P)H-dependent flavin oxidoreductase YrpB (nitropropane dioxygenase family)
MGWIARTQLASAVSRAGGLGIIETSSGETAACQHEVRQMLATGLHEALETERHFQASLFTTQDFHEGRAAFLGKRQPVFKGL